MDEPLEIVSVRATMRTSLPRKGREAVLAPDGKSGDKRSSSTTSIDAYSFGLGQRTRFQVVNRGALSPGPRLLGPAIILEDTSTTYLDHGFSLEVHSTGSLLITDGDPQ
jgi:N-methylhydantoinase A